MAKKRDTVTYELKQGNKVNLLGIFYNLIPSGEDRLLTTSPLLFLMDLIG